MPRDPISPGATAAEVPALFVSLTFFGFRPRRFGFEVVSRKTEVATAVELDEDEDVCGSDISSRTTVVVIAEVGGVIDVSDSEGKCAGVVTIVAMVIIEGSEADNCDIDDAGTDTDDEDDNKRGDAAGAGNFANI